MTVRKFGAAHCASVSGGMKLGYFWRFEIPVGIYPSGHE